MTLSTIGDQFNVMQPIQNITSTLHTVSAVVKTYLGKLSELKKKLGIIQ